MGTFSRCTSFRSSNTHFHAIGVTIGGPFKLVTMIPKTQTLLFSLVFLCGPQEVRLSPLGRCSKNEICSFISVMDFKGAEGLCSQYSGELYKFSSKDNIGSLSALLRGSSGKYWLQSTDGTGPNCPAVSVEEGQNATVVRVPCQEKLDGLFCKMQVCAPFEAPGGSPVTYTFVDFKFHDSEAFPMGTIAVAQKVGSNFPDSKHLCAVVWLKAPWTCEVMSGGCQSKCNASASSFYCACPPGERLHPNDISCSRGPRAESGRGCLQGGGSFPCTCAKGYRQDQGGKGCVDVDECKEARRCAAGGLVCVNTQGSYECRCRERGFVLEEGVCVNVSICKSCEHDCEKISGEYQCSCRDGFMASPSDPTRCTQNCTERDCRCISKGGGSCDCPYGYVKDGDDLCTDINECEAQDMCQHVCENLFGGFRCLCHEGFQLQGTDSCVSQEGKNGSAASPPWVTQPSTPAGARPASLPSYIRTGSVLGITVFIVLAAGLLVFLLRYAVKRCGKFELSSLKRPDIDIFYLQQVTTETYKRLSFDKQFKSDTQKLELNL